MSTTTTNLGFSKAVDADNAEVYLATTLPASLDTVDALFGAWTSFTPTMTQSVSLTLSVATGKYARLGKLVFYSIDITINSAGTASNQMVIAGIPIASAQKGTSSGMYVDSSASQVYQVTTTWASTTSLALFGDGASSTNGFGVGPAVTAAASDTVRLSGVYEAA